MLPYPVQALQLDSVKNHKNGNQLIASVYFFGNVIASGFAANGSFVVPHLTSRRDLASRLINASASTIYSALVKREAVEMWLPPEGATMQIQRFEPHVGGQFQVTLTFALAAGKSTNHTDVVVGRFVDLVPSQLVVQWFEFDSPDPAFAGRMSMRWILEPREGGTNVTVIAENVPSGIAQADHEVGLQSSLAQLAAYAELSTFRNATPVPKGEPRC